MKSQEHSPGLPAPQDATYEQLNVLGSPTGVRVTVTRGELLPPAPRGFTWVILRPRDDGGEN